MPPGDLFDGDHTNARLVTDFESDISSGFLKFVLQPLNLLSKMSEDLLDYEEDVTSGEEVKTEQKDTKK